MTDGLAVAAAAAAGQGLVQHQAINFLPTHTMAQPRAGTNSPTESAAGAIPGAWALQPELA